MVCSVAELLLAYNHFEKAFAASTEPHKVHPAQTPLRRGAIVNMAVTFQNPECAKLKLLFFEDHHRK